MPSQASKKGNTKGLAGRLVHVSGQKQFNNELLAYYLKREIDVQCNLSERPFKFDTKDAKGSKKATLILIECPDKDLDALMSAIERDNGEITKHYLVALFNVDHGYGIEEKAVARGIKGIFYKEDPLEHFQKGIGAIFEGELWVSREVLTKYVMGKSKKNISPNQDEMVLTSREIEILAMISIGAKNEEIAEKLCISPNTVKTHIYNIFKKIDVPNRLQAALWAAKNL